MPDPIKIIKNEHRIVEKLFKQYNQLEDTEHKTKKDVATQICNLLKLHAEMEEKVMYPKQEKKFKKEGNTLVSEAYAEHEVAKGLIAAIDSGKSKDSQFDAQVKVLEEIVAHHVQEEENELLPKTKKEFSDDELSKMGSEMEAYKLKHY